MACFKWHLPKRRRKIAPAGRTPWNRDGFDSLDRSGPAADSSGFPAAAGVWGPPGGRTSAARNCLPAFGVTGGNCGYQLLRGVAPALMAPCSALCAGDRARIRALDLLAAEMNSLM